MLCAKNIASQHDQFYHPSGATAYSSQDSLHTFSRPESHATAAWLATQRRWPIHANEDTAAA